ncbi:hypothetical protein FOA52_002089 [Chlamydomonas sp. UWO 241]|nr:hypothetical protein FOA52_002089 [Chlamydomonas sp. UWO 241]
MASGENEAMTQYLLLAKGARGRALSELITRATSEPTLFAFGELLDVPTIAEGSKSDDLASSVALLELFAYGTWPSYKERASSLPAISPQQANKLKQLTVVALAIERKTISYESLMAALDIPTVREVEDFIIAECFYTGVVKGKLDQRQRCLQVHDVIGRDVRPSELGTLAAGLGTWLEDTEELMRSIEGRIQYAQGAAEVAKKHATDVDARTEEIKKSLKIEMDLRGGDALAMMGDAGDFMDEDRLERPAMERAERSERATGSRSKRRIVR